MRHTPASPPAVAASGALLIASGALLIASVALLNASDDLFFDRRTRVARWQNTGTGRGPSAFRVCMMMCLVVKRHDNIVRTIIQIDKQNDRRFRILKR